MELVARHCEWVLLTIGRSASGSFEALNGETSDDIKKRKLMNAFACVG